MKNITVFISSFLRRGHRWQLAALVALFFVAGCTVELYPPAQEVNNLPDGGKVDVLPDTIPRAFAFGPRIYWSQIIASDSSYSIAVTDANNKGRWLDSLRWVPSGPYVTVNGDTLATRAYARDNSALTGDNQVLIYNGSGSLTIENGNTVDMSDLLDNTDAQTIDTLALQGDTMLQVSLSGDGAPVKELDLSALRSVVDSTRLAQDSILVYYQDGVEIGRDTIGVTDDNQVLTYNGSGSLAIEDGNTVDMSDLLDNTDDQTIDTLSLSGTTLSLSLESDGQAAQTVDLSALAVIDSTRLAQDSILVYYQDGIEVGRDTISGTGGGGGSADNLGDHTMTQNLQTNGNWISGDGGNEGIGVDADGKIGVGTTTPLYIIDINSTDAVRLPVGTTAQRPTGANGLLRYNSDLTAFEGYYNAEWNRLSSTLADISAASTTTAKSLYTMTSGQNIEFRRSGGSSLLYMNESNGMIGVGTSSPTEGLDVRGSGLKVQSEGSISGIQLAMGTSNNDGMWITGSTKSDGVTSSFTQYATKWLINGRGHQFQTSPSTIIGDARVWTTRLAIPAGFGSGIAGDIGLGGSITNPETLAGAKMVVKNSGNVGIGVISPTAVLNLKAGTATASTAPLKFTSGTNLTTPEAGAMEWDGTNLYITQTTGSTRKTIAYVDTDDGSASDTTDGSGDITVSHTLGSASITVTATATGTTFYHVQVHSKTSTTFKIRFYNSLGPAATSTAVTADWIAKLQ